MKSLWYSSLALTVSLATSASVHARDIDPDVTSPELLEAMKRGEIAIENALVTEAGGAVRVQALMHGEQTRIWEYIASCERAVLYVEGLRDCQLLETRTEGNDDISTVRQVVKKSWMTPKLEYSIEVRRSPPSEVNFQLLEGDLKVMDGGWRFLDTTDGLLVTYEIQIRPSFPFPRWLVRRSMRKDMPDMLACLRGLTGLSGPWSEEKDLSRCPRRGRK